MKSGSTNRYNTTDDTKVNKDSIMSEEQVMSIIKMLDTRCCESERVIFGLRNDINEQTILIDEINNELIETNRELLHKNNEINMMKNKNALPKDFELEISKGISEEEKQELLLMSKERIMKMRKAVFEKRNVSK